MRKECVVLEQVADAALGRWNVDVPGGIEERAAVESNMASRGMQKPRDGLECQRLACAGGAVECRKGNIRREPRGKVESPGVVGDCQLKIDIDHGLPKPKRARVCCAASVERKAMKSCASAFSLLSAMTATG